MKILVLNSGSSTQKSALYEIDGPLPEDPRPPLWEGKIEWQGGTAAAQVKTSGGGRKNIRSRFRPAVSKAAN